MYYKIGNFEFPNLNILSLWFFSLKNITLKQWRLIESINSLVILDIVTKLILVLVNIAFITLLERKVLSYSQLRLGPNKPSVVGILQPMADAVKLFSNKAIIPYLRRFLFSYIPFLSLLLILMLWTLCPRLTISISFSFSFIVLLALIRLGVYPVLLAGWSSNRKYAELGRLRNVAQTISYEVSLALILLIVIINLRVLRFTEIKISVLNLLIWPFLLICWLLVAVAETNRTPFDFAEGESELVSGFNTEYSRNKFAAVFIAEYGRIYFLSALSVVIFFSFKDLGFVVVTTLFVFFWIWLRATLPRHRYDNLIMLNWKSLLPLALLIVFRRFITYGHYNQI